MRGGRDEIGSWVTPPADRRWVPLLLLLASRLSLHPRHWRSSVKSRCEPPNNGAVVEIVAYLKIEMEKGGRFPFSMSPIYLLGNRSFSIFRNEQKERKTNRRKIIFFSTPFLFFFFFNSHNRVCFFVDHAGCCQERRCEGVG